jgi:hypothetical protein
MTESAAGIGTASESGFPGLSTIGDTLDVWAWNRRWPVAKAIGRMRLVADGLAEFMGSPWSVCRVRKRHRCTGCSRRIRPGSVAYRPLREGAGVARYARLCPRCISPENREGL